MTKFFLLAVAALFANNLSAQQTGIKAPLASKANTPAFIQNKGQVSDQFGNPRPDVLFSGSTGNVTYHLRHAGISYQLGRIDAWQKRDIDHNKKNEEVPFTRTIYRLDINWLNSNSNMVVQPGNALPGYSNYYLPVCPQGATYVQHYQDVTYKNIYNNIDLHYYSRNGALKYDFLVAPYANYKSICLQVNGAESITLQKNGSLLIHTPLGNIEEGAPLVYQNNKPLKARWIIKDNNVLRFHIEGYDRSKPLVIDPLVRAWGTWYGGNQLDYGNDCVTDAAGNVYLAGETESPAGIATSGMHQVTYSGYLGDAYLAVFNTAGVRQWATYYGGSGTDFARSCAIDAGGNIYMAGTSASFTTPAISGNVLSTPGSHQPSIGGLNTYDAFLVKFNSSGIRDWGTYYGGSGDDTGNGVCIDNSGDVYLFGHTESGTGTVIATPGSHQPLYGNNTDTYLAKFNSAGVRQWGTYYGGGGSDFARRCKADAAGNIYIVGESGSSGGIASTGGHQPANGGGYADAFLAKFNTAGVRQWATYYGGSDYDNGQDCAADAAGNVYLTGYTSSTVSAVIATPGAHLDTYVGAGTNNLLAYLVQFNAATGARQWGTYYGATIEAAYACAVNATGDVYIAGGTSTSGSSTAIATPGCYQGTYGGANGDVFIARFSVSGTRLEGTYYGGSDNEGVNALAVSASGDVYITGESGSFGTALVSSASHQPVYGGGTIDAYLVRFTDCQIAPAAPSDATVTHTLCAGNIATLAVTPVSSVTVNWFANPSSGTLLHTGSIFTVPLLGAGTYTYYAEAFTCTNSAARTAITLTVIALPATNISATPSAICEGSSATLSVTGADTFTWSTGGSINPLIVSPAATSIYSAVGTNTDGCSAPAFVNIVVNPLPVLNVTTSHSVICAEKTVTLNVTGAAIYSWSPGSNASSLAVTPSVTTVYTVTGINNDNCAATISFTQQVDACLGIASQMPTDGLNIYPNPTAGIFIVDAALNTDIIVTNALGQFVLQQTVIAGKNSVNLAAQAGGIYFLKMKGNPGAGIKIIKE